MRRLLARLLVSTAVLVTGLVTGGEAAYAATCRVSGVDKPCSCTVTGLDVPTGRRLGTCRWLGSQYECFELRPEYWVCPTPSLPIGGGGGGGGGGGFAGAVACPAFTEFPDDTFDDAFDLEFDDDDGDVYVGGELIYDCPPYGWLTPEPSSAP